MAGPEDLTATDDEDENPRIMEQLGDHAAEHYPEFVGKTVPAGMLLAYIDLFHYVEPDEHTQALQHAIRTLAS